MTFCLSAVYNSFWQKPRDDSQRTDPAVQEHGLAGAGGGGRDGEDGGHPVQCSRLWEARQAVWFRHSAAS